MLKATMVYGFALQVWDCKKKSMVWINTFNYPAKNAVIRTLDGRLFNVKVFKIGCDFFFFNGWLDMITALKIPSKSWLVFQYEEALACFRIFYFYEDVSLAPSDYFYYKSGCVKDRANCMHANKYFVHHKMLNTVPTYPVVV
ncbi:hypothetical protein Hanom_Chr06g00496041 [Helianthus anomalus]